jgi:ABC-2 type transport system permease protein
MGAWLPGCPSRHGLFWFSVVLLVIAWQRPSAVNAVVLLDVWLVVRVPSLLNLGVSAADRHVPQNLELTIKQGHDEIRAGWDKPQIMNRFFARYPQ